MLQLDTKLFGNNSMTLISENAYGMALLNILIWNYKLSKLMVLFFPLWHHKVLYILGPAIFKGYT